MQKPDLRLFDSLITPLSIEYIGEILTLNQKDPILFIFIFLETYSHTDKV